MTIPTGGGTEVLCRGTAHALSSASTALRFDRNPVSAVGTNTVTVPANHIITILSISFAEVGNANEEVWLSVDDGTNVIYIIVGEPVPAQTTFMFNDKIHSKTCTLRKPHHKYVIMSNSFFN